MGVLKYTPAFIVAALLMYCNAKEENNATLTLDGIVIADPSADDPIFEKIGDMTIIKKPENDGLLQRNRRNAVKRPGALWPNGVVPYQIASTFSTAERRVILQAMKHWEDFTCIRFRPRTTTDHYYVVFMGGRGCRSFAGRVSRGFQPQGLILGRGCVVFRIAVHEIGHAIGFFHEHQREDRDQHIRILESNIRDGAASQFVKYRPNTANTLYIGYDHASIMHYNRNTFARSGSDTIVAQQPNIPIGGARELSPLDIAKTNALYRCGPHDTHPPPSVVVPQEPLTIPGDLSCGSVINTIRNGSFTSPGYPRQLFNQRCAYVLKAPEGYGFRIRFPQFQQDVTPGCREDFVQIFRGASISPNALIRYRFRESEGRLCNERERFIPFHITLNLITIYYQTNDRNTLSDRRGLRVSYELIDRNECLGNQCHRCTNTPGSFICECNEGYYLSTAAKTCYDVNECAINNGGCEHTCTNFGGSYRCSCRSGFFLQANGLSCGTSRPSVDPQTPPPGTIIPKIFRTPPTTQTPTRPLSSTTRAPSTTPPTPCGKMLRGASGTFTTPNWPLTYPFNFECEWNIVLPDSNAIIEISFDDDYGIAGQMPACDKDQLIVYDGENVQSERLGLFCHLTRPDPIRTTSNHATLIFRAGPRHGPTRHGFKATYHSISKPTSAPTTSPPITPSPTTSKATTASPSTLPPTTATPSTSSPTNPPVQSDNCWGGFQVFTTSSGSIQSKGWPDAPYPININCKWTIQCPASTSITVSFDSIFRIAGRMPSCPKDQLKITTCGVTHGPYCHLTAPQTFAALNCNTAEVSFNAGSGRGATRFGFKLNYLCI